MTRFTCILLVLAFALAMQLLSFSNTLVAQTRLQQQDERSDYPDHQTLSKRLQQLAQTYPQWVKLQSLTQTQGGKDIWLLNIGKDDLRLKPAIAVVGGVSGDHLLGSELALQFAERLLKQQQPGIDALLERVSFYVFPDMSPDARAQYFAPLRYERLANARPTDPDRDGYNGKDPYIDLNADGMISLMRIRDPGGAWMPHPEDGRIMVKARHEKGERGAYRLYKEGVGRDKEGAFIESLEEGVVFNRNFTFGYKPFSDGAGEHAVSETETRALVDFLFDAKNVFAVFSFGEANNLSKPLKYNDKDANKRIFTGWKKDDIKLNEYLSKLYNKHMGSHLPPAAAGTGGDFFQWAYFHYGRFSFSTQGWAFPHEKSASEDAIESRELDYLQWAEGLGLRDVFIPWTPVAHPDFADKEVEVGGMAPFVMKNPPYALVDSIAVKHTDFILEVARLHPNPELTNLKTEKLGKNLHRVSVDVFNSGHFPTVSQAGLQLRWVQKTVLRLMPAADQELLSGKIVEVMGAIDGQQTESRSWLIHGKGELRIRLGTEETGIEEKTIKL